MINFLISFSIIFLTLATFWGMRKIYLKYPHPLLMPVLTTTVFLFLLLLIFGIPYSTYMEGGRWLSKMLEPAIVALAYPLYKNRKIVLQYKSFIIAGVLSGFMISIGSMYILADLFAIEKEYMASMLPKSITAPVAVEISNSLSGIPSLTAAFVLVAGFSGILIGPKVMEWVGIKNRKAMSIALGTTAHALGISKATEYGEIPLSMSSIAMTFSAILGALITPILVWLI
ncbi:LrgB family protein [Alkalihalobacillus sp. 1P02AB]|uniref:LrgB family protein n=1 Tax=Alkalihalobacillus sp. 1P02AB TaxID=3132260 RepID=UPI0039A434CC